MEFIDNPYTEPGLNLAFEEFIFKNRSCDSDSILILWKNDNAVIIGRYQHTIEQINSAAIDKFGVKVVRRITGGGAVYHDLGNLNYTFITSVDNSRNLDFKSFAGPVVKALRKLGVAAQLSGRNDIVVDGKKISGTAQCCMDNKVLFHGTLLFDSDLDMVDCVLKVDAGKIESKGIKSVKARVTNIRPHISADCTIDEFKLLILKALGEEQAITPRLIAEDELEKSKKLADSKYADWEWNYGQSPKANYFNEQRLSCGSVKVGLQIEAGRIESCRIFGDFLGYGEIEPLERALRGAPYAQAQVKEIFNKFYLKPLFNETSASELLSVFFST